MKHLTKNEEIILLTIWRLKEEAYGVRINNYIKNSIGKDWNYGTLYCILDQLVKKGMVSKKEGKPMPERGGRRKIYYTISQDGRAVLQEALEMQQTLWHGVTAIALKEEN